MASGRFKFTDVSGSETNLSSRNGKRRQACYISVVMGFILLLLADVAADEVEIIAPFLVEDSDMVCNCTDSIERPIVEAIKDCENLTALEMADICSKCPTTGAPINATSDTVSPNSSSTTPAPATTPASTPVTDVRLPKSIYPIHYDVELQPYMYTSDPKNFTFKGFVRILVRCDNATDNITFHINVLTVDPTSIRFYPQTQSGDVDPVFNDSTIDKDPVFNDSTIDKDREFFIVLLDRNMEVGKYYILEMNFTSPLKKDLAGLYYSEYKRGDQRVFLATTQFQPTAARKAFPCFDEPAIKATFNITLVRANNLTSISNMPIIDSSETFVEDGITYVKDVYATTPKMSTYLLAFIISDFEYTIETTKNNVLYRAWSTPESLNQTLYSLDAGVKILEYFEEYFNVSYPLPKQDMIAIPDFGGGAMENWGLSTFRDIAMLYKEGVSNEADRERVAIVVSHEIAHQWFGDLVTPSWWDDLWLNEGFASFMEYLGVDEIHPDWKMFDKFVINSLQSALGLDGLVSSHPVYVPVGHPHEIYQIFDLISYAKGASIIRMMRHFLGESTFKKGLTHYLNKLAYGAAFHDDLWNSMSDQTITDGKYHINVKSIMDTWTLQMNFPVVMVTQDSNDTTSLSVKQERYLVDPNATDPGKYKSPFGYRWEIPLTFTSSSSPNFDQNDTSVYWMHYNETEKTFSIEDPLPTDTDQDGWILANVQQYGYYRVNYNVQNWNNLCNQLTRNHTVIPIINRAQIINDAWNLAKSGHIGLDTALDTIKYLDKERDHVPWYAVRDELNFMGKMLSLHSLYGPFQQFMQSKLRDTFDYFWPATNQWSHVDVFTRSLIAGQSCYYGIETCLTAVTAEFKKWMDNPNVNPIDVNLKIVVYCYAIRNGGYDEWKFALEMYNKVDVATEKAYLLSAMSCSDKPWILNNYMRLILQENSPIRTQDALIVIAHVARSTTGRYLAWNFFRSNFQQLKDQFGAAFAYWIYVIGAVTESFNTRFELDEVSAFKKSQSGNLGIGERAFEQAIEKVSSNIKWMEKNVPVIEQWLKTAGYFTQ